MTENDLRRLIIKMLMLGVLEEQFVSTKISGQSNTVSVYIVLGKKYARLEKGQITVVMSHGVPKGEALKMDKKSQEDKQEQADEPRFKSLQDFKND